MSGSSGGPIVNSNNEIVGQLFGDSNGNADWCVTQSDGTNKYGNYKNIDGEFLTTYNTGKVAEILVPFVQKEIYVMMAMLVLRMMFVLEEFALVLQLIVLMALARMAFVLRFA